ncbi:MAG: hypothetical protein JST51_02370 [Armatimonadetes bacterium]|nr:hypothetical protein [Armatimonadota bacterium]
MLASAIVLMLSPLQRNPDIAFSARFYRLGKERSFYHLYLCRFDGTHRRQLTFGSKSQITPIWLDKTHLAYSEVNTTPAVDSELQRRGKHLASIKVLDLESEQSKTLLNDIPVDDPWMSVNEDGRSIVINDTSYSISKTKVVRKQPYRSVDNYQSFGQWNQETNRHHTTVSATKTSPVWNLEWTYDDGTGWEDGQADSGIAKTKLKVSKENGKFSEFSLHGDAIREVCPIDNSRLYIILGLGLSRIDNSHFVYQLDCETNRSKLLADNVGDIDFRASKGIWIGYQAEARPIREVPGAGQVWANSLYSGDIATGKRWTIVDGLVHLASYATRPK